MVLYGLLLVCIGLLGLIIWFCLRLVRGDLVVVFGYWLGLVRLVGCGCNCCFSRVVCSWWIWCGFWVVLL